MIGFAADRQRYSSNVRQAQPSSRRHPVPLSSVPLFLCDSKRYQFFHSVSDAGRSARVPAMRSLYLHISIDLEDVLQSADKKSATVDG